ncbi:MAG: RrF2 family transcriptional regulator [Verrucomicrobiota bacterium]|jgi:Rrf2 family protein
MGMFSQTAEYALRAAIALAQEGDRSLTTDELAVRTKVPRGYLSKVLQQLHKGGVVRAIRGIYGGYALCRPPGDITMIEVVNAVDPIQRIHTCPLNLPEHGDCLCPLHQRMDRALAEVERAFSETTLEEVVQEPSLSTPLCPWPGGWNMES